MVWPLEASFWQLFTSTDVCSRAGELFPIADDGCRWKCVALFFPFCGFGFSAHNVELPSSMNVIIAKNVHVVPRDAGTKLLHFLQFESKHSYACSCICMRTITGLCSRACIVGAFFSSLALSPIISLRSTICLSCSRDNWDEAKKAKTDTQDQLHHPSIHPPCEIVQNKENAIDGTTATTEKNGINS